MYKSIRSGAPARSTVVVGVTKGAKRLPAALRRLDGADELAEALRRPEFSGTVGDVARAGHGHILVGLGAADDLTTETLRKIGGRLAATLESMEVKAASLQLDHTTPARVGDAAAVAGCVTEGIALRNWRVDFHTGTATRVEPAQGTLVLTASEPAVRKAISRALHQADAVNWARMLAAMPPNECTPAFMARTARSLARKYDTLTCRVIGHVEAEKLGMGGLIAVGRASAVKPCLVVLEHKPPRAARGVKLALVGKTITYDTGGYSLKISNGMKGMKYDKNGGMAVIGAMRAIAALKVPVHVVAVLPCAENMVGGDAYRPDDIITMLNGVTVEVTNTDAEGRLVLGDALAWVEKYKKPTAIVDVATLTGGVVVGLGHFCAGLWCRQADLLERVQGAAERTDERVWQMPLWDEHRDFMRARHADVWNSAPSRNAHPIQGAAFLSYFVDEKTPWAHLDIAGVSSTDSATALCVEGPTGYGVRLLTELARSYAKTEK